MKHIYQSEDKSELVVVIDGKLPLFYPLIGTIGNDRPEDIIVEKAVDLGIAIADHNHTKHKKGGYVPKNGRHCSNCGLVGHQARTCPGIGKSQDDSNDVWGEALTRKQFSDVKISFGHGMSSLDIAKNMDVEIKEVNAVQRSSNYDMYLGRRGTDPE